MGRVLDAARNERAFQLDIARLARDGTTVSKIETHGGVASFAVIGRYEMTTFRFGPDGMTRERVRLREPTIAEKREDYLGRRR